MANRLTGWLSPALRRQRLRVARAFVASGQVLDYGCGIGALADLVPAECYTGLDLDVPSLEEARRLHPHHRFVHVKDFVANQQFDVVILLAVIQYIEAPARFLEWCREILSPQAGRVVITTPKPSMDGVLLLGARLGFFGKDSKSEHPSLLDKSGFERLATESNFVLDEFRLFLFGTNQLAVLRPTSGVRSRDDIERAHA